MDRPGRTRILVNALGTARTPAAGFIGVSAFVLAAVIGTVAGLEDSSSGLPVATRLWRWYVADFTTAAAVTLGTLLARRVLPGRWFAGPPNARAVILSYGSYALVGLAGGLVRYAVARAVGVPPLDATLEHHFARAGVIPVGLVLLGFLANQYQGFLDRIHAQERSLRDRIAELGKEVTERRHAEDAAAARGSRLDATLRTMAEGVLLANRDGRVVMLNQAAERLIGHPLQDALGRELADAMPSVMRPLAFDIMRLPAHGRHREVEIDGSQRIHVEVQWTSIVDGPEAGGRVVLLRDVTEERTARQASEQEQRLAALGQLVAGIAHDFNNLLTGMIGATEALKMRDDLPEDARRLVERANDGGVRGALLVRQLLDFSRGSPAPMAPLDVAETVLSIHSVIRHVVPENVRFSTQIAPGRFTVSGNANQLERLLLNLAVNASQAMPEGGELRVRVSLLTLAPSAVPPLPALAPGSWVEIAVSDTGLGIPPENLGRVFDPFFTTKAPQGGTGLGLAQVHGIARQHEGYVAVSSHLGVGTTFTVYLPAVAQPAAPSLLPPIDDIPLGYGETVLLVEDDPLVRDVIQVLLERLGYRTLIAGNGQEALDLYRVRGREVHVVLTDFTMPSIGGAELALTLRDQDPNVKVIVFTGYAVDAELRRHAGTSVFAWLEKPPALPVLAQALRRALETASGALASLAPGRQQGAATDVQPPASSRSQAL